MQPTPEKPSPAARLRALLSVVQLPLRSLPARITFFVAAATLVTSLLVMWSSMHSTYQFLGDKIDRKFPAVLQQTAEKLDLWYAQRRVDLETFASSATLVENAPQLAPSSESKAADVARREVQNYLGYVLERFEPYEALFVLDADGRVLRWVGAQIPLSEPRRVELARVAASSIGPLQRSGEHRFQLASAPIRDAQGKRLSSLHALVRAQALEAQLRSPELGASGEIYLVAPDARYLTPVRGRAPGDAYQRTLPGPDAAPQIDNYTSAADVEVVGSALHYPAFDWTLVVEEPYRDAFEPAIAVIWRIAWINLAIVALFGVVAFRLAVSITRPVEALCEGARRVAEGQTDVALDESSHLVEIALLTRTFNKMTARLHRNRLELQQNRLEIEAANSRLRAQNEELQRANESLEQVSLVDGLTGLNNHRFLQEQLKREIAGAQRSGDPLALLLFDIDDFKQLNDRFGHAAGDGVLRDVASVLQSSLRESDVLARYGGEEFAVIAPRTDAGGAATLGEKLRLAIAEREFEVDDIDAPLKVRITVSVGVALFSGDRSVLFSEADRALYRAKGAGRDCVVVAATAPRVPAETDR